LIQEKKGNSGFGEKSVDGIIRKVMDLFFGKSGINLEAIKLRHDCACREKYPTELGSSLHER
jgi:hypothetical protein